MFTKMNYSKLTNCWTHIWDCQASFDSHDLPNNLKDCLTFSYQEEACWC